MDKFITAYPRGKRSHEDSEDDFDFKADDLGHGHSGPSKVIIVSDPKTSTIDETKNYLLDGKYYKIVSRINESKMVVSCQQCSKQIIAHSNSIENLLSHYKVSFNN